MLTVVNNQKSIVNSQRPIERDQREVRYRDLLREGNIDEIRKEFPKYFTGRPAVDSGFGLEKVTRPDLQARMTGQYLDVQG